MNKNLIGAAAILSFVSCVTHNQETVDLKVDQEILINDNQQYNTPYENFPDAYEDSSFNPYHGYIPHTQINKR